MRNVLIIISFIIFSTTAYSQLPDSSTKSKNIAPPDTSLSAAHKNQTFDTTSLQKDIKALLNASTTYLTKNSEAKSGWDLFTDRTDKIVAILTALVALIISILALVKGDFLNQYKPIIATIAVLSFSALLAFLLAGFLQVIIVAAFAIALTIFLFFYISLKYIELFDRKGYKVIEKILNYFEIENKIEKDNDFVSVAHSWLQTLLEQQIALEAFDLKIKGSFIRGYDFTSFKIIPTETENPHYIIVDDKLIIPINIDIHFIKGTEDDERVLFKNIQHNQLVITATKEDKLNCNTFYSEGFRLLGINWSNEMQLKLLEKLKQTSTNEENLL